MRAAVRACLFGFSLFFFTFSSRFLQLRAQLRRSFLLQLVVLINNSDLINYISYNPERFTRPGRQHITPIPYVYKSYLIAALVLEVCTLHFTSLDMITQRGKIFLSTGWQPAEDCQAACAYQWLCLAVLSTSAAITSGLSAAPHRASRQYSYLYRW